MSSGGLLPTTDFHAAWISAQSPSLDIWRHCLPLRRVELDFPTSSVAREKVAEVSAAFEEFDRQDLTRVAASASALVLPSAAGPAIVRSCRLH
jgi:hypothetical protein